MDVITNGVYMACGNEQMHLMDEIVLINKTFDFLENVLEIGPFKKKSGPPKIKCIGYFYWLNMNFCHI